jgi:hypothetical protein
VSLGIPPALRRTLRPFTLFVTLAAAFVAAQPALAADDLIAVPGGPAAIRRLLRLESDRPPEDFLREVHQVLLFEGEAQASWSQVESRKAVVDFVEDLADWRKEFGRVATFSTATKDEEARARRMLAWLGIAVEGEPSGWSPETRTDSGSLRRRRFLDALGWPIPVLLSRLRAGLPVAVAPRDETVPLPLGLAVWREILNDKKLDPGTAFLSFVQNVRASRMLVTVQALDAGTLEGLAAIGGGKKGIAVPLTVLYEKALDSFAHYPEALSFSEGKLQLPGGREADAIWKDVFGVLPSSPEKFVRALYETDSGKGAYVIDALQQLPESVAHAVLLGRTGGGEKSVDRFRRIYRSIEKSAVGFELARRDPHDFAHIARFLRLTDDGELGMKGADLDGDEFPRSEADLDRIVADAKRHSTAEETLARIFRADTSRGSTPPRRRFLFVSDLIERRPELEEAGLVALLLRGADRFYPAYAVLEDVPVDPPLARRYLFALDRLDRRRDSARGELDVGLFQSAAEIVAQLVRSGAVEPQQGRELLSALVDQPLFAEENAVPAGAQGQFFAWISDRMLGALRKGTPEGAEPASADDVLARALVGPARPFPFDWHGGRYVYDPTSDELSRRAKFRELQRLATLEEVEGIFRMRGDLLAAASKRDADAAHHAATELSEALLHPSDLPEGEESDKRIVEGESRARQVLEEAEKVSGGAVSQLASRLSAVDELVAERVFEALLGHVYSISAGDPDDLYYQDPDFVRHHSFQTVEKGGRVLVSPFGPTILSPREAGGGFRISGSVFGLPDILGLLHAEQITYKPGAFIGNDQIRSGLVGPVRRMSPARLEDDALAFVAASCRATEEFAESLAARDRHERLRAWQGVARDLVPRARLARLAELGPGAVSRESVAEHLSPSDLFRIGRRLALAAPSAPPAGEGAGQARDAAARLREKFGERGATERLAEFGPRAVAYLGRMRLSDLDMPPYERLAAYRTPQLFSDRLYDAKLAVARVISENGMPAALLPLVLPGAVDKMMAEVRMAFAYDWKSIVRKANAFAATDLEHQLDDALKSGRLVRDESAEPPGEGP